MSPAVARVPKNRRQHLVARLLAEHAVTNQGQLVELLAAEGVPATQATVSRDLEELGAVRVRIPGVERQVYALAELPKDQVAPLDHLRRVLGEWVVDLAVSGNLVVVRTPPGSAHVVASALDRTGLEGVLGTVAGDDTVLVIADEVHTGHQVGERIAELAGADLGEPGGGLAGGTAAPAAGAGASGRAGGKRSGRDGAGEAEEAGTR